MLGQLSRYHDWAAGSTTKDSVFDSQEEQDIFSVLQSVYTG